MEFFSRSMDYTLRDKQMIWTLLGLEYKTITQWAKIFFCEGFESTCSIKAYRFGYLLKKKKDIGKAEYLDSCRRGRAAGRIDRLSPLHHEKRELVSPKRVSNIIRQSTDQLFFSMPQFLTRFSPLLDKIYTIFFPGTF